MNHPDASQVRRLSFCRQLSDVLKFKRRSLGSISKDPISPSSKTTLRLPVSSSSFFWNCRLAEDDSSAKEDFKILSQNLITRRISIDIHCSVKETAISYDDLVFIASNEDDEQTMHNKSEENETTNRLSTKTSSGKERTEKRNSIGSAILSLNSKSLSKRLSSQCMMLDNDENHDSKSINQSSRTNKINRSSIFTSSIFTRDVNDSTERPESNLSFIRRKCDEWLIHGLPKLAQLQFSINECDLIIDKEWQPCLNEQSRTLLSETIKLQQEAIYEMLSTEVSYIRQILTMTDIFMTSINILKSSQRDGIFNDIDMDKLFSNIKDVLEGNLLFWKEILLPMRVKLQQTGLPMDPSDLKDGFMKFDIYFKPYLHYVLDQKASAEYFKQKFSRDDLFQHLITWIEANFTNRLSFSDLTIKPLQRLTRYKLLLEAIQKKTQETQQRNDLLEMIQKVATFVNRVNSKLHNQEQEERVRQINDHIGPYENVIAPPELTSILQEYNRDSMLNRLNLLEDMPLHVRGYRRQIIQQGPMKMKDAKNSQDVYCYLFSDMFLITKGRKRSGSTTTSVSSMTNDAQSNRGASNPSNKILKSPIRIDRIDVREYDRRGGSSNSNTEPNIASFVAIVVSEYNLIESAFLFQTNLSKQWIDNIRRTKTNFNLLMEESKIKNQTIHHPVSPSCCTVSTNTIHQSLPSLSLPLTELPPLIINETGSLKDDARRLSKVESNVFKIVEQTRRNSRTDRKNFGRYFTADGSSTHGSNSSSPPIKQVLSSSTTIIKRMSWNNDQAMEKNDSSLITNSFRSVHSSSGVSSTGSFLFSTDEDSSITTTTTSSSIPSMVPSIKNDEFDEKSLASTVIETDDQLVRTLSIPQADLISEDLIKSNLEDKNNQQLISQISPSSTSTLISNSQTMIESTSSINNDMSSPESSLRRIPYPSVRKRNQILYRSPLHQQECLQNKISIDNDIDSIKSNDDNPTTIRTKHSSIDNSSLASSGNESDYDNNNQCTAIKLPVNDISHSNELTRTNETTQQDNNEQSDTIKITSKDTLHRANKIISVNPTATTLDDSAPTSFQSLLQDPITTRRLLDIRSHLLLNTTLDATEV
ncbi:unnamed protein product [Rotaria magnacalcarata]|uniref:DH domain-containing protein n=1 Tax=Rotaria magnacalcarata TaxID=392030 RepID=A0A816MTB4_9BILA|nr:unnamed protein product [Rotaria magnacalcarata]CAF2098954.1 unnamed protein product [Rotaria magnacalcarata]